MARIYRVEYEGVVRYIRLSKRWHPSGVEYQDWWALEPWQSLSATVAHRPKVRIANPHTGKRELVELKIPPRHIPIHVTRIN